MPIMTVLTEHRVPVWIWTDDIDEASQRQLLNVASLPFVHHHVAAMPDVHLGIGATIGSVIATHKAIIPAAVGVDIGCGMVACRLSLTANDIDERALQQVFDRISRDVPVGFAMHDEDEVDVVVARSLAPALNRILAKQARLEKTLRDSDRWWRQLGTLGGGNHFIEICLDEKDRVWAMLHSGSRNIGKVLAEYFIELARQDMECQSIHLPDRDLAYFPEGNRHFDAYIEAVHWAQEYAYRNRELMLDRVLTALHRHVPAFTVTGEVVNCHHNYVAKERHFGKAVWVTRKGAIRARAGELGIVPGSMGARSYIVRGLGNPDSFCSSAHGAGRRMSRNAATRAFTTSDLSQQTAGVLCRKDKGVLDEIPGAYKDIDTVMAHQRDLTETLHTLKQILCIKG